MAEPLGASSSSAGLAEISHEEVEQPAVLVHIDRSDAQAAVRVMRPLRDAVPDWRPA